MIKIYGASDDLIEVEGDVVGEEIGTCGWSEDDCGGDYLCFSNGVIVFIAYGLDGTACWRVKVIANPANIDCKLEDKEVTEDGDYSETLIMNDTPDFFVFAKFDQRFPAIKKRE